MSDQVPDNRAGSVTDSTPIARGGTSARVRHRATVGLLILILAVLLAGTFALGWVLSWSPKPPFVGNADTAPVFSTAERGKYDGATAVTLTSRWEQPPPLLAPPGLTGLVSALNCEPGGVIAEGQFVMEIDGVGRVALATAKPLTRRLARGDVGDDVNELRKALVRLGFDAGSDSVTFDRPLEDAVVALQRFLGIAKPARALDPQLVVWLRSSPLPIGKCALVVGQTLDAGARIAEGALVLTGVAVAGDPGIPDSGGALLMDVLGETVPITDGLELSPESLAKLQSVLPQPKDLQEAQPVDAAIRLKEPVSVVVLPASALIEDGSAMCVLGGTDLGNLDAVPVVLLRSRLSVVEVAPRLPTAQITTVLANPRSAGVVGSCG